MNILAIIVVAVDQISFVACYNWLVHDFVLPALVQLPLSISLLSKLFGKFSTSCIVFRGQIDAASHHNFNSLKVLFTCTAFFNHLEVFSLQKAVALL